MKMLKFKLLNNMLCSQISQFESILDAHTAHHEIDDDQ